MADGRYRGWLVESKDDLRMVIEGLSKQVEALRQYIVEVSMESRSARERKDAIQSQQQERFNAIKSRQQ